MILDVQKPISLIRHGNTHRALFSESIFGLRDVDLGAFPNTISFAALHTDRVHTDDTSHKGACSLDGLVTSNWTFSSHKNRDKAPR